MKHTRANTNIDTSTHLSTAILDDDSSATLDPRLKPLPAPHKPLASLPIANLFDKLDLSQSALKQVKSQLSTNGFEAACAALLAHYRTRFSKPVPQPQPNLQLIQEAQGILQHRLPLGNGEVVQFPDPIDYHIHPVTKNVPGMVPRMDMVRSLGQAYAATADDHYVAKGISFIQLFLERHPLSIHNRHFSDRRDPRRWMWMDLNAVRRVQRMISFFTDTLHSPLFTSAFLAQFLAAVYDHAHLFHLQPNPNFSHNMAVSEQSALTDIAIAMPEFSESSLWAQTALARLGNSLASQINSEGVQVEWCPSYHANIMGSVLNVISKASAAGLTIPPSLLAHARLTATSLFNIVTPDDDLPAFGDTKHHLPDDQFRTGETPGPMAGVLGHAGTLLNLPDLVKLSQGQRTLIAANPTTAQPNAGLFAFRSSWKKDAIYLALQNPPGPENFHCEPSSLSFELYAFGRWLMTDTGYYTYGEDAALRPWHRQTHVHQTLTLDSKNSQVAGRTLLWSAGDNVDCLTAENASYPGLTHRRTIWFVDKRFFVLLDEAIGDLPGQRRLHFQLAPSAQADSHKIDEARSLVTTGNSDVNVALWSDPTRTRSIETEEGWHAYKYAKRTPRPAFSSLNPVNGPCSFLTVIVPYLGTLTPTIQAKLPDRHKPGDSTAQVHVQLNDESFDLTRTLPIG